MQVKVGEKHPADHVESSTCLSKKYFFRNKKGTYHFQPHLFLKNQRKIATPIRSIHFSSFNLDIYMYIYIYLYINPSLCVTLSLFNFITNVTNIYTYISNGVQKSLSYSLEPPSPRKKKPGLATTT